jgi:hypothetical protein
MAAATLPTIRTAFVSLPTSLTVTSGYFGAEPVALGGVGDPAALPWRQAIKNPAGGARRGKYFLGNCWLLDHLKNTR